MKARIGIAKNIVKTTTGRLHCRNLILKSFVIVHHTEALGQMWEYRKVGDSIQTKFILPFYYTNIFYFKKKNIN